MKRVTLSFAILIVFSVGLFAQKKKINIKKPNLRIGEKLGDLAGNLMTAKTTDLSVTSPVITMIVGVYDPSTGTSEAGYFPKGTQEGDHMIYATFMKNEGVGMYKVGEDVTCAGSQMNYVGLGSYGHLYEKPITEKQLVEVTTETGDHASFELEPIPGIEIIEINGDPTLPIIDLDEDLRIKFSHPKGAEGTTVKVGLLTNVAGARAWNYFADFKSTDQEVLIPKESFSNLEISGALNAGQVNKGMTHIVVLREKVIEQSQAKDGQIKGNCTNAKLQMHAYSSKPVIVKGKQENGVIAQLKFSGRHKGQYAYSIYKPNARTGIPFSRASKFGLVSLSISGSTYKKETESNSSSWTAGGTQYTQTWTRTTTYEFPQLPGSHWEKAMDVFYKKFTLMFNEKFGVEHIDVDKMTSSALYTGVFPANEVNTDKKITKSYKNTSRMLPQSFGEIMRTISSSQTGETQTVGLMAAEGIDGLVSMSIDFEIGADKDDKIILLPKVSFSIKGMDETKDNREGSYADGFITLSQGVPYSEELVKTNPNYLAEVLNIDQLIDCMTYMLLTLKDKEVAMGYDKIWSIGE